MTCPRWPDHPSPDRGARSTNAVSRLTGGGTPKIYKLREIQGRVLPRLHFCISGTGPWDGHAHRGESLLAVHAGVHVGDLGFRRRRPVQLERQPESARQRADRQLPHAWHHPNAVRDFELPVPFVYVPAGISLRLRYAVAVTCQGAQGAQGARASTIFKLLGRMPMLRNTLAALCLSGVAFHAADSLTVFAQQPIRPVPMIPFADGQNSVLMEDLVYRVGTTNFVITVPKGFVTDFASTPRAIWAVLPPTDKYQLAAIVHDFLYWDQQCTRAQADALLRVAMSESNVAATTRDVIWRAVQNFGGTAWTTNAQEKAAGRPRVIPSVDLSIPPLVTWADYRAQLIAKGVKPEPARQLRLTTVTRRGMCRYRGCSWCSGCSGCCRRSPAFDRILTRTYHRPHR
jgi:Protein of unknown function (DUF1353)